MNQEKVTSCPICSNIAFEHYMNIPDFTATQEIFRLEKCKKCDFIFTNPRPTKETIDRYYNSDKYISHTRSGKNSIDKIYLLVRKVVLIGKHQLIYKNIKTGTLLDYGCGTGEFLSYMQNKNWEITGVEPNDVARKKASDLLVNKPVFNSIEKIETNKFDVITLWHVLEHIHNLNDIIKKLKTLLSENGIIILALPNHESADAKIYQKYWAAYDVPRHLWHFSKKSITNLMSLNNLYIKEIKPMKLDSYYISLLSEGYQYPQQNKLITIFKAFINGFSSNLKARKKNNHSSLLYIIKK